MEATADRQIIASKEPSHSTDALLMRWSRVRPAPGSLYLSHLKVKELREVPFKTEIPDCNQKCNQNSGWVAVQVAG